MDTDKCKGGHGEKLTVIYDKIFELAQNADRFVREQGFTRFNKSMQTLHKVMGVGDLALWRSKRAVFEEIPPKMVKKLITGNGNATKEEVCAALPQCVGHHAYACDDESDAVAVGIAWIKTKWKECHRDTEPW